MLRAILTIAITAAAITCHALASDNTITVVVPSTGEKAYGIAADSFIDMWEKVTGRRPARIWTSCARP